MNFRLLIFFVVASLFLSSFSCSNKSGHSIKPAVQIKIESANRNIAFGDDINIGISVKIKDGQLKETKIYVDTVFLTSSTDADFSYSLKKFESLGKHTLKAVAVKTDGVEGIIYGKVTERIG